MAATRGTDQLQRAGIEHRLLEYGYGSGDGGGAAEEAAALLGVEPERMFKSLVAQAGEELVFGLVAAGDSLSLKKLAAAAGSKSARMAAPADAERATGYQVGGISPLGSRRRLRVFLDATASGFERICLNAGGRGLIVELETSRLVEQTGAVVTDLRQL
jgi:Cys-tRNA(Pro)/Cys-tRNA(Cys) deacylase